MSRDTVVNAVRTSCEHVLRNYGELARVAAALESPNPAEDAASRMAIVGFGSVVSLERWGWGQAKNLTDWRASELTPEALAHHEEQASAYEAFACACYGALLGLCDMGALSSEDDLLIAELALAAFIVEHAPEALAGLGTEGPKAGA
jgi:hypothetical protein